MSKNQIQTLEAKLRRFADALTSEETAQLSLLLERAGVTVTTTGESEVRGYRVAQYEDAYGWKGPIGTGGESLPPAGGSNTLAGISYGLLAALAAAFFGGPAIDVYNSETGQYD